MLFLIIATAKDGEFNLIAKTLVSSTEDYESPQHLLNELIPSLKKQWESKIDGTNFSDFKIREATLNDVEFILNSPKYFDLENESFRIELVKNLNGYYYM